MPSIKHASIDSLSKKDVNDMFEYICKKVCLKPVKEVKELMDITNEDVDVVDLINLIKLYDIKCEIKISYVDATPEDVKSYIQSEPPTSRLHKEMEQQAKVVNKENFCDTVAGGPKSTRQDTPIDPSLIPKFG